MGALAGSHKARVWNPPGRRAVLNSLKQTTDIFEDKTRVRDEEIGNEGKNNGDPLGNVTPSYTCIVYAYLSNPVL